MAELVGLVSGERLVCFSESCGPLPDLGAAANAPRLGSVASGVPSGVHRSPRKVRLLRRAPRRLRPVAAGAADGFGAGVDLNVDRMDESCGLPWRMAWFVQ